MTELANVVKGEAALSIKIEEGKVKSILSYDGKQADATVSIELDAGAYLDMLAEAIPGEIDDTVIALLKAAISA